MDIRTRWSLGHSVGVLVGCLVGHTGFIGGLSVLFIFPEGDTILILHIHLDFLGFIPWEFQSWWESEGEKQWTPFVWLQLCYFSNEFTQNSSCTKSWSCRTKRNTPEGRIKAFRVDIALVISVMLAPFLLRIWVTSLCWLLYQYRTTANTR